MLRTRWPIAVFCAWTLYVWVTRIVNAWTASDETTLAKSVSTVVAAVLLVAAALVAATLVRARHRALRGDEVRLVRALVVATVLVWLVRVPQILLDGARDVPFKVVHLVLAAISLALAYASWRAAGSPVVPAAARPREGAAVSPADPARR